MAEDDIFGKIDALLEKRAGFRTGEARRNADEDFPLLTEVVELESGNPSPQERRQADRRLATDRRQVERRKAAPGRLEPPPASLTEEQFNRFMTRFEQKLEDLFIRQQLRLEEAVRRALQARDDGARGGPSEPL